MRLHRRVALREEDVTVGHGIPVTTPTQTLLDLAARRGDADLERCVNEADKLGLVDSATLLESLDRFPGRVGVGRLRSLLAGRVFLLTDSELERRFLRLVEAAELPAPLTRQVVCGYRVDFFWPDLRLVVETDGLRYHRTPAQQQRDRERDQALTGAGFVALRFTHAQVRFEAPGVLATLRAVVARLSQ